MNSNQISGSLIAVAILAGGQSTRMGICKATLPLPNGRTMLEAVAAALQGLVASLIIVGPCPGLDLARLPGAILIEDPQPWHGPLSGLATLLVSNLAERYLMVGCDQPLLTPEVLMFLLATPPAAAVCFEHQDKSGLQPLPGCYHPCLLPEVHRALELNQRGFCAFLRQHDYQPMPLAEEWLPLIRGINTPQEFQQATRKPLQPQPRRRERNIDIWGLSLTRRTAGFSNRHQPPIGLQLKAIVRLFARWKDQQPFPAHSPPSFAL
jgi:molybdopterin-guanine dinucleotide biosynthesis protein A